MARWTFITNHGAVIVFIAKHNRAKAAEIAAELGTTERSVRRMFNLLGECRVEHGL